MGAESSWATCIKLRLLHRESKLDYENIIAIIIAIIYLYLREEKTLGKNSEIRSQ